MIMELIKVGAKTYYLKNATNIGIYLVDDKNIYLIDSGNDKDAGKKVLKIVAEQGWQVKGIINTHAHADHIGGNQIIQERTGCAIYGNGVEACFTEQPILEPTMLYGGCPFADLRNKFLLAKASRATMVPSDLPDGLSLMPLAGHSLAMVGVRTSDNVVFLGDAVLSQETIDKYHLFYLYDVKAFLATLDTLSELVATLFIPSHCAAVADIKSLIKLNRDQVNKICAFLEQCCALPLTFETILKAVFDNFHLTMNANQYVLVGSTVRSYLSYLCDIGKIKYEFCDNQMLWSRL